MSRTLALVALLAVNVIAEETVAFQPGLLAKIYVCGKYPEESIADWDKIKLDVADWPIKALPDAPAEIQRLRELPEVEPTSLEAIFTKRADPNYLVPTKSGIMRGVNFYAVEFEGYYFAAQEGLYTVTVTSDDPVDVFIEGKLVLRSEFAANPIEGPTNRLDRCLWNSPWNKMPPFGSIATKQATFRCSPNRYYHVLLVCRQRWYAASRRSASGGENPNPEWNYGVTTCDLNRGAVLKVVLATPDNKSGPMALQLPVLR